MALQDLRPTGHWGRLRDHWVEGIRELVNSWAQMFFCRSRGLGHYHGPLLAPMCGYGLQRITVSKMKIGLKLAGQSRRINVRMGYVQLPMAPPPQPRRLDLRITVLDRAWAARRASTTLCSRPLVFLANQTLWCCGWLFVSVDCTGTRLSTVRLNVSW